MSNWLRKPLTPPRRPRQRLLSILLLTATATACFALAIPSAVAQQNPKPPVQNRRVNRNSIWDAISKLLQREEPPLGSRGNVCAITPGLLGEKNVIFRDRPLFVWQGAVQRLDLRPYSLYSKQDLLWSQTLTTGDQSATYNREALQPGQTYDWELVVDPSGSRKERFTFQVMDAQSRNLIATELTAMEKRLKSAGATGEAIAQERANYFAQRGLWSDALQEVFSVKNPSADLTRTAQEISAYLCGA